MSVMTPTRRRQPRGRSRARRNDKPVPCRLCRTLIVFGRLAEADGSLADPPAVVRLNAKTSPMGWFEYLRGPVAAPVVKELDELERLIPAETARYFQHHDIALEER